jgi:hypothetical protein
MHVLASRSLVLERPHILADPLVLERIAIYTKTVVIFIAVAF